MLNVAQITSRLAMMPDAALQQYAALHKEDPYIMALAVSESNRRKQMRNAAQVPQGGEMPKVADQALAEMSPEEQPPEEQGIARLPTGEMNFAGGGIVAFADGGDVERYQAGGMPLSMGTEYGIPGMTLPTTSYVQPAGQVPGEATIQRAIDAANLQSLRFSGVPLSDAQKQEIRARFTGDFEGSARAMSPAATPARTTPTATPPAAVAVAPATPPDVSAQRPAERPAPAASAAPAQPKAGGFDMSPKGLMALRKQLGEDISVEEPANLRAAREALTAEEIAAAKEAKASLERDQAKFADAFKGREERLAKREAQIGKDRDTNTGLAFLNAGLAIMSTPGSLATAIGKGARVGTEQYAAGLDKLRAAQDKLEEARDRLDELKLNRDMMDAKEIRAAEAGIRAAATEGKKRGVAALEKMFDVSNKRADSMFTTLAETGLTMYREGEATKRTNITAGAPSAQERMFRSLGGGDLAKGIQRYSELTGESKGETALVAHYAKDPAALKVLETTNPQLAAIIKQRLNSMLVPQALGAPTGPVRP